MTILSSLHFHMVEDSSSHAGLVGQWLWLDGLDELLDPELW